MVKATTSDALRLDAVPESAGLARRHIARVLSDRGLTEHADTAQLLVSELVTNAVLYARTAIEVRATTAGRVLRVEVVDRSPMVPVPRRYGAEAITGRGLELVHLLASAFGVDQTSAGKVVWFTLGGSDEPVNEWTTAPPTVRTVQLRRLPVALFRVLQEHNDALLREYALHNFADGRSLPGGAGDAVTAEGAQTRLLTGVEESLTSSQAVGDLEGDSEHVDVAVSVPPEAVEDFEVLLSVLQAADRLAADGRLLTAPALPELLALRIWCCRQVVGQLRGGQPVPWRLPSGGGPHIGLPPVDWDASEVSTATEAVLAADDSNRIVAVSAAAAAVLGWTVDELVGQRVVAIVPPRLRERHVAGFSRAMLLGGDRALNTLQLPALRRDGSEVLATVSLDRVPAGSGRIVFVATIRPA